MSSIRFTVYPATLCLLAGGQCIPTVCLQNSTCEVPCHKLSAVAAVGGPEAPVQPGGYPVRFDVDYPDRPLNRLTTAFRIFTVIPIFIVLAALGGYSAQWGSTSQGAAIGGGLILTAPTLLMILFRPKYPRWWFDWNLQVMRFANRVGVYLTLMDDRYPSTDEEQSVRLDFPYPD